MTIPMTPGSDLSEENKTKVVLAVVRLLDAQGYVSCSSSELLQEAGLPWKMFADVRDFVEEGTSHACLGAELRRKPEYLGFARRIREATGRSPRYDGHDAPFMSRSSFHVQLEEAPDDPLDKPCECLTKPEPKGKMRDCPTCMYFLDLGEKTAEVDVNEFNSRIQALLKENKP